MTMQDTVFEEAFKKVGELIEKLGNAWQDITGNVNSVLRWLPGFLEEPIKSAFNKCSAKVTEVLDKMATFYQNPGSASAIRTAGDGWNQQVGARASTQAGLLVKEQLETDNEWTGDAADRYGEAVTAQNKALAQIKTITENLQTTLNEIASAVRTFWVSLGIAFVTYIGAAIVCIAGVCTAVAAAPALIAFFTASVAFLTAVVTFANNFSNTLEEKKAKLEQQSTMDGPFANGEWPPSAADKMSDGSVNDGDKSDWTPK
jgi:uncharacterized protein YukE